MQRRMLSTCFFVPAIAALCFLISPVASGVEGVSDQAEYFTPVSLSVGSPTPLPQPGPLMGEASQTPDAPAHDETATLVPASHGLRLGDFCLLAVFLLALMAVAETATKLKANRKRRVA